jgi:hypothetical protein
LSASFLRALPLCLKSVGLPQNRRLDVPEHHVSRNESACPHLERQHPRRGALPTDAEAAVRHLVLPVGASMLVDDIADRIAIARPDELDGIVKDMWVDPAILILQFYHGGCDGG